MENRTVYRILDANFNRAREALRVMEDYVRFCLNDPFFNKMTKSCRHTLADLYQNLSHQELLAARDTPEDVGTEISTAQEMNRLDNKNVLLAAGKRLTEALRSLEEYGKVIDPDFAAKIELLRYQAYDIEKKINQRLQNSQRLDDVKLYVIVTQAYCQNSLLETVEKILEGGVDCIQLREKELDDKQLLKTAKEICQCCHAHNALFIMNDRADIARLAGADGVHVGQDDLSISQARQIIDSQVLVGKSSHDVVEADNVIAESADYLAIGSIFASSTKPDVEVIGTDAIAKIREKTAMPIYAIGGVDHSNAHKVIQAGANGIVVCQALINQSDPKGAAEQLKNIIA